jgi:serine/threonine protein kinase
MGNLYELKRVYNPIIETVDEIKSLTDIFSPPEVLQLNEETSRCQKSMLETSDVYSWAISFYSLLLKKSQNDLREEANKYKLSDKSAYSMFLHEVEAELKSIRVTQDQDEQKLKAITEELIKILNYNPDERPKMEDIVAEMKQILNLNKGNITKEEKKANNEPKVCSDCLYKDKKKVVLECGHGMCKRCILKYVFEKFDKKENYNHKVMCSICEEVKEIGIIGN